MRPELSYGSGEFTGALVLKSITLMNNSKFTWDSSIAGLASGSSNRFYPSATGSYKECTSIATDTAPDSGC